jgi:hypothetical protein
VTHVDAGGITDGGLLLAGRYRVQRRLGSGAMGVVWLALDERLDRLVAVKQLWPGPADSGDSAQRVMREGRIAARLRHPHVVTVHDVAEDDGQPLLVMEYVPARSLATVVAEQGSLTPPVAARVGAQVAAALAAAHAAGVVHRDVKPANVLVGDDGTAKIADFGISHATGDVSITRAGVVAGTPAYLAPEVARGHSPSPDSDVYSLGATLYAAVEGRPPFGEDTDNAIAVLHRVAEGRIPPPARAGALMPVLLAMLAPEPARRPTASQVSGALEAVAEGRPVHPRLLSPAAGRTQPVVTPAAGTMPVLPLHGPGGTRLDNTPVAPASDAAGGKVRRGSRRSLLLAATGVAVVVIAVVIALTQRSGSPATTAPPPPTPTAPALDPATLTGAVSAYYALLPAHPDQAWQRLGPALQVPGPSPYRSYWSTVTGLTVTSPPDVTGPDTVTIALRLTLGNRTVVTETHQLGLIPGAPTPLINSDTVLNSQTATPAPPPPAPATTQAQEQKGSGGTDRKGEDKRKGEPEKRGHGG